MSWVPVAFAALLLAAVLYPVAAPFLARERRARHAHRGGVVHWYPNYDEAMQFEPRMDRDIIPVTRGDLERLGYRPGFEDAVVPRTFRRRVPGDDRFRLWTSTDESLRPVWICCWKRPEFAPADAERTDAATLTREMLLGIHTGPTVYREAYDAGTPGLSPVTPDLAEWEADEFVDMRDSPDPADKVIPRLTPQRAVVSVARTAIRAVRNRTHRSRTRPSRTRR